MSFAGEDRDIVEQVVRAVNTDKVFYDADYAVETWGADLVEYFSDLYQSQARFVVIFVSRHYAEKAWTRLERRSALSGAMRSAAPKVLPVRLDDTKLPGLLPTVGFLEVDRLGIAGIANAIDAKLTGTHPSVLSLLDGRVPRTVAAIEELKLSQPPGWEPLLFAALLMSEIDSLEEEYRDHSLGFVRPSGQWIDIKDIPRLLSKEMSTLLTITRSLEALLAESAQEVAFGSPWVAGDIVAIQHLANRIAESYAAIIRWSSSLRGISTSGDHGRAAIRALSDAATQPIEEVRHFVRNMVAACDTLSERIQRGERVEIIQKLTFKWADEISSRMRTETSLALKYET